MLLATFYNHSKGLLNFLKVPPLQEQACIPADALESQNFTNFQVHMCAHSSSEFTSSTHSARGLTCNSAYPIMQCTEAADSMNHVLLLSLSLEGTDGCSAATLAEIL